MYFLENYLLLLEQQFSACFIKQWFFRPSVVATKSSEFYFYKNMPDP
jgi:hypothetical protein